MGNRKNRPVTGDHEVTGCLMHKAVKYWHFKTNKTYNDSNDKKMNTLFFFTSPSPSFKTFFESTGDCWCNLTKRVFESVKPKQLVWIYTNIFKLPDPCVAFLVSVSPCFALIESGLLSWPLKTLVGPIKWRHTAMASSRASIYASDGPLYQ